MTPDTQNQEPAAVDNDDDLTIHEQATDYVDLVDEIKQLEDDVKRLKKERDDAADALLARMVDEETPRLTVKRDNGKTCTVYPNGRLFASVDKDADPVHVRELLRRLDLEDLIRETVNAQSLSAAIRELADERGLMDGTESELRDLVADAHHTLKISNKMHLAVRRG